MLFMLFTLFVRVKSSCKKKIKRFKIALIPSSTVLLLRYPVIQFYAEYCYRDAVFGVYHEPVLSSILKTNKKVKKKKARKKKG